MEAATSHTHVMSLPGRSRTFFYHGGASALLNAASVDPEQFAAEGYRLFYLGYLMLLPVSTGWMRKAAQAQAGCSSGQRWLGWKRP